MNRIHNRRHSAFKEWAITIPIVMLCAWWLLHQAHELAPEGTDPCHGHLVIDVDPDGPNECPNKYLRGDFINGGSQYTCWKADDR
jgi:hypothetical protein